MDNTYTCIKLPVLLGNASDDVCLSYGIVIIAIATRLNMTQVRIVPAANLTQSKLGLRIIKILVKQGLRGMHFQDYLTLGTNRVVV